MILVNNLQSINNRGKHRFCSPSFTANKTKAVAELTAELFSKFPEKIQQQILSENPDIFLSAKPSSKKKTNKKAMPNKSVSQFLDMTLGDITRIDTKLGSIDLILNQLAEIFKSNETATNIIKMAKKQLISAKGDVQRADTKIREVSGIFKENAENIPAVEKKKLDINKVLEEATAYKSKKYNDFNNILDSKNCKREHVEAIIKDIGAIKVDYRHFLVEKMIDVAVKNKDTDLLNKLYYNLSSGSIKVNGYGALNCYRKIVDAAIKTKMDEAFIFKTFFALLRYGSTEECAELNKKISSLILKFKSKPRDNKITISDFLSFNNRYYKELNLPKEIREKLARKYNELYNYDSDYFFNARFPNFFK